MQNLHNVTAGTPLLIITGGILKNITATECLTIATRFNHLWGSKRTGPDLARVGGRYSDEWHRAHLYNPRDVVPLSNMPAFPWLFDNAVSGEQTAAKMTALRRVGVPYSDEDIANAAQVFASGKVKEVDALVAYMQQLGTLIKQKR